MTALPRVAVLLIGTGTGLVWLLALLAVMAELSTGAVLGSLDEVLGTNGVGPELRNILVLQWAVVAVQLCLVLVLGTLTLLRHWSARHADASRSAVWFVRGLIALEIVGLVSEIALPFAVSGSVISAVPGLLTGLPVSLVTIAFLLCADRYLNARLADAIFA